MSTSPLMFAAMTKETVHGWPWPKDHLPRSMVTHGPVVVEPSPMVLEPIVAAAVPD